MQEAVPDNVELRLGYGAMLLGKLGQGADVCSLDTILGDVAKACALCTVAVATLQVCHVVEQLQTAMCSAGCHVLRRSACMPSIQNCCHIGPVNKLYSICNRLGPAAAITSAFG